MTGTVGGIVGGASPISATEHSESVYIKLILVGKMICGSKTEEKVVAMRAAVAVGVCECAVIEESTCF